MAVTAMAQVVPVQALPEPEPEPEQQSAATGGAPTMAGATQPTEPEPAKRSPAHYLRAALIYQVDQRISW